MLCSVTKKTASDTPSSVRRLCDPLPGRAVAGIMMLGLALVGFVPAAAQDPDTLAETYADWTVRCSTTDDTRRCWMGQSLQREPGGEQLLLVELALKEGATHLGVLAPFGLLLSAGIMLKVDDHAPSKQEFRTCLPPGCISEAALGEHRLAELRAGTRLEITMVVADSGAPLVLDMSLSGFTAAHSRLTELVAEE